MPHKQALPPAFSYIFMVRIGFDYPFGCYVYDVCRLSISEKNVSLFYVWALLAVALLST